VELRGPEPGIELLLRQRVAEVVALCLQHQLAEPARRQLSSPALLVEGLLEVEARGDVEQEGSSVSHASVEERGTLLGPRAFAREPCVDHELLRKGRRRLRQRHGVSRRPRPQIAHHEGVVGVAELVGERRDVAVGSVVGDEHARFADPRRRGAEASRPLARPRPPIDPAPLEGAPGELGQLGMEGLEGG
jgi:hypothetical protein